jgi:hypothetical protein
LTISFYHHLHSSLLTTHYLSFVLSLTEMTTYPTFFGKMLNPFLSVNQIIGIVGTNHRFGTCLIVSIMHRYVGLACRLILGLLGKTFCQLVKQSCGSSKYDDKYARNQVTWYTHQSTICLSSIVSIHLISSSGLWSLCLLAFAISFLVDQFESVRLWVQAWIDYRSGVILRRVLVSVRYIDKQLALVEVIDLILFTV